MSHPFSDLLYVIITSEVSCLSALLQLLVNFILSTLTVLLHISAIFNIPLDIAMIVAVLIFSEYMTGKGWPDVWDAPYIWQFCAQRETYAECGRARDVIKILMGVSAGVSIIIVLLLVAVLALELASLSRKLTTGGETKLVVQFGANPLPNLARLAPDENVSSSGQEA
ncbi:hypothetical protein OIDMADRAFT_20005 [Oidiodendron maius Zn]|uniref:Uncharacterized protein n=1 Tax=Oidiodendron maius (strain Zn) TaxID=913774 RepID=A0A0C3CK02_OIDMZ|nr:hypothetical protein OIDMADRAFT_20005 [Oidiodendron maius Zn]